ncbi:isocitrate lyase/phosphoenolpyruvate mutase family protein [Streptomyces sp. C11-1]|uniref:Isocitrate lyase/phosphoenolpyruvate mutase family protein n=1 Tax=Streptomyces durocortorensis TaxID=2811104 RepID=A0ABY9VYT2_9ACTN|nr:isocitrate lyase/phosphoenolpyruvate mutase family protein [Streptomyces durocortorensis]WNF29059.1 isocitrate lyase/phosphoenolpyruvate mutase family protein [Streptomyces durocortorensis]
MADPAAVFRALHHGRAPDDPLVLPGPWDAASARALEEAGFPALAIPSAGVAASLGHEDGRTPADEMFAAVTRIVRAVSVPVSADIEAGYGLEPEELVDRLLAAGAVGCNLEDSVDGVLLDPDRQADRLARFRAAAGDRLFLNARVDVHLHAAPSGTDRASAATGRALRYAAAGADCVYPIAAPPDDLPRLAAAVPVPLNAIGTPDSPAAVRRLGELGASRVTFGPALQRLAAAAVREAAQRLR